MMLSQVIWNWIAVIITQDGLCSLRIAVRLNKPGKNTLKKFILENNDNIDSVLEW